MIKDSFFLHIKAREGVLQTDLRSKDTDIIHLGIPPSPPARESPSGWWGEDKGSGWHVTFLPFQPGSDSRLTCSHSGGGSGHKAPPKERSDSWVGQPLPSNNCTRQRGTANPPTPHSDFEKETQ